MESHASHSAVNGDESNEHVSGSQGQGGRDVTSSRRRGGGRPRSKLVAPPGQRSAIIFGPAAIAARGASTQPINVDAGSESEHSPRLPSAVRRSSDERPSKRVKFVHDGEPAVSFSAGPPTLDLKPEIDELEDEHAMSPSRDSGMNRVDGLASDATGAAEPSRRRWAVASPAPESVGTIASGLAVATQPSNQPTATSTTALRSPPQAAFNTSHATTSTAPAPSLPSPPVVTSTDDDAPALRELAKHIQARKLSASTSTGYGDRTMAIYEAIGRAVEKEVGKGDEARQLEKEVERQKADALGAGPAVAGPSSAAQVQQVAAKVTAAPAEPQPKVPSPQQVRHAQAVRATDPPPPIIPAPAPPAQPVQAQPTPTPTSTPLARTCIQCGHGFPRVPFPTAETLGRPLIPGAEKCLYCISPAIKKARDTSTAREVERALRRSAEAIMAKTREKEGSPVVSNGTQQQRATAVQSGQAGSSAPRPITSASTNGLQQQQQQQHRPVQQQAPSNLIVQLPQQAVQPSAFSAQASNNAAQMAALQGSAQRHAVAGPSQATPIAVQQVQLPQQGVVTQQPQQIYHGMTAEQIMAYKMQQQTAPYDDQRAGFSPQGQSWAQWNTGMAAQLTQQPYQAVLQQPQTMHSGEMTRLVAQAQHQQMVAGNTQVAQPQGFTQGQASPLVPHQTQQQYQQILEQQARVLEEQRQQHEAQALAERQQLRDQQMRQQAEQPKLVQQRQNEEAIRFAWTVLHEADLLLQQEQRARDRAVQTGQAYRSVVDYRGATLQNLKLALLPQLVEAFLINKHPGDEEHVRKMLHWYQMTVPDIRRRGGNLSWMPASRGGQQFNQQPPQSLPPAGTSATEPIDLSFSSPPAESTGNSPNAGPGVPTAHITSIPISKEARPAAAAETQSGGSASVQEVPASPMLPAAALKAKVTGLDSSIKSRPVTPAPQAIAALTAADAQPNDKAEEPHVTSPTITTDQSFEPPQAEPAQVVGAADTVAEVAATSVREEAPASPVQRSVSQADQAESVAVTGQDSSAPVVESAPAASIDPSDAQAWQHALRPMTVEERLDEDMYKQLGNYSKEAAESLRRIWRGDESHIWTDENSRNAATQMALDRKVIPWITASWRWWRLYKSRAEAILARHEEQKRLAKITTAQASNASRPEPAVAPKSILKRTSEQAELSAAAPPQKQRLTIETLNASHDATAAAGGHLGPSPNEASASDFQPNGLLSQGPPPQTLQRTERILSASSVSSASNIAGLAVEPAVDSAVQPVVQPAFAPRAEPEQATGIPPAQGAEGGAVEKPAALTPEQIQETEDAATHWFQSIYTSAEDHQSVLQAEVWQAYLQYTKEKGLSTVNPRRLFNLMMEWLPQSRRGRADDNSFRLFGIRTRSKEQQPLQPIVPKAPAPATQAQPAQPHSAGVPAASTGAQHRPSQALPAQPVPSQQPRPAQPTGQAIRPNPVPVPRLPGVVRPIAPARAQPTFQAPAPIVAPIRQKPPEERMRSRLLKQWDFVDKKTKMPLAKPWLKALNHANAAVPGQPVMRLEEVPMAVSPIKRRAKPAPSTTPSNPTGPPSQRTDAPLSAIPPNTVSRISGYDPVQLPASQPSKPLAYSQPTPSRPHDSQPSQNAQASRPAGSSGSQQPVQRPHIAPRWVAVNDPQPQQHHAVGHHQSGHAERRSSLFDRDGDAEMR